MRDQEDPRAGEAFASFLDATGYHALSYEEKQRLWEAFVWARVPDHPVMRFVLGRRQVQAGQGASSKWKMRSDRALGPADGTKTPAGAGY